MLTVPINQIFISNLLAQNKLTAMRCIDGLPKDVKFMRFELTPDSNTIEMIFDDGKPEETIFLAKLRNVEVKNAILN